MHTYVQIIIAAMTILVIHIALLVGFMQQTKIRLPDAHRLMQVSLHLVGNEFGTQSSAPIMNTKLSETSKPDHQSARALQTVKARSEASKPTQSTAENSHVSGNFRWRSPSAYQQRETMNAMQLQQIAFQRKAQVAAVLEGMSKISSQLAPIITAKIICTQEADDDIACVPEPTETERLLIVQFVNLARQAHQLGVTENPINLDFGATLGVSVSLR